MDTKLEEEEITKDEMLAIAQRMARRDSSTLTYPRAFIRALSTALTYADEDNTWRIKRAFPELWEQDNPKKRVDLMGELVAVMQSMARYGGSFEQALANVLMHCNYELTLKIKAAWPESWAKHSGLWANCQDMGNKSCE